GMHEFSRPPSLFGSAPHLIALDVLHPPHTIFSALPAFHKALQDLEVMKYPAVTYPPVSNHECVLEFHTQRVVQLGTAKGYGNRRRGSWTLPQAGSRCQRDVPGLCTATRCRRARRNTGR